MGKAQENGKKSVGIAYATAADFRHIFTEDINSLYLVSLLLTGKEKAEECFVTGIAESTEANYVFKEWARSWARRTIIQSAIRLIGPRERSSNTIPNIDVPRGMDKIPLVLHAEVRAILGLAPLSALFSSCRFSTLLGSRVFNSSGLPQRDIATARARAMQQLVTLLGLKHKSPTRAGWRTPSTRGQRDGYPTDGCSVLAALWRPRLRGKG